MSLNGPEKRNAIISKFADEIRRLATKHETYLSDFFVPKDINRRKVDDFIAGLAMIYFHGIKVTISEKTFQSAYKSESTEDNSVDKFVTFIEKFFKPSFTFYIAPIIMITIIATIPALIQSFMLQSDHSFKCAHKSFTKFMFPPSVPSSQNLVRTRQPSLDLKLFQVFAVHLLYHVHSLSNHNGIFPRFRGDTRVHKFYKQTLM